MSDFREGGESRTLNAIFDVKSCATRLALHSQDNSLPEDFRSELLHLQAHMARFVNISLRSYEELKDYTIQASVLWTRPKEGGTDA